MARVDGWMSGESFIELLIDHSKDLLVDVYKFTCGMILSKLFFEPAKNINPFKQ
jgi:hypothetical protein